MSFKNEVCVQQYRYDFDEDGGAAGFIDLSAKAGANALPTNAVVMNVLYNVETAMTSGGAATVAIGDNNAADTYKSATAFNDASYAADTPDLLDVQNEISDSDEGAFGITIASAALTAGVIYFTVQYVVPGGQV